MRRPKQETVDKILLALSAAVLLGVVGYALIVGSPL